MNVTKRQKRALARLVDGATDVRDPRVDSAHNDELASELVFNGLAWHGPTEGTWRATRNGERRCTFVFEDDKMSDLEAACLRAGVKSLTVARESNGWSASALHEQTNTHVMVSGNHTFHGAVNRVLRIADDYNPDESP